jgi:hypothetical protein
MALPTLDVVFASAANVPRRYMLAQWLVKEKGETQGSSSVLVSGLDIFNEISPNGTYLYGGILNDKSRYNKSETDRIIWSGGSWLIIGSEETLFLSDEDVAYPWLVTNWTAQEGTGDPVITEISTPSPLSNYYTLPERYLWAKIAVAAGAPRSEADYISLPKQYVWSDIYNAVSGDIAESTVVVSGLSATYLNGRYVYDGDLNGKPSYILTSSIYIYWESIYWILFNDGDFAKSESDVAYPWLATNWFDDGINPTGLVLTPKPPNHTDWSEKQALGHIAAAYRGDTGNPANLATYIDWPWRYQVASIITAL